MIFSVIFKSKNHCPLNLDFSSISIFDIDLIKEKTGKNLHLSRVNDIPKINCHLNPLIRLDHHTFKKVNKFKKEGNILIEVIVPDGSLNKYIYKDVYVKKDNNEIIETGIEYKVNEEELLSDWRKDGAPKIWGNPVKILSDKIKNKFK